MLNGQILIPDHKSAKASYGLDQPEFLDATDKHFLRVGHSTIPPMDLVFQLTEASEKGLVVAEIHDASDQYHEGGIHESKVVWEK